MKKILSIALLSGVFFGAPPPAPAATIYTQNWGSPSASVTGNGNINLVGWTGIAVSQTAQPYLGIFQATGASDPVLGLGLPVNTVYLTGLTGTNQPNGPGMFYTTDSSGNGGGGNSSFTDINPLLYTNLTFNIEVRGAATDTNYFAVRIGASWFVATSYRLPDSGTLPYPQFTNDALVYTNAGNVWNNLTQNSTYVTIGSVASPNLSAPITGIGIVELNNTNVTGTPGFNYNELVINQGLQDFPSGPPTNTAPAVTPQTVYVGGGASFLSSFAGTPNLIYQWKTNGVNLNNGGRIIAANTTMLTITNVNVNDGTPVYSVVVTNFFGKATNDSISLTVQSVPDGLLYAETFPYVGPNGNLPITGVGWLSAASAATVVGIYQPGPGLGDVFSYSPSATTNIYYTTSTNDVGLSGLPFANINPASYPAITFQAGFVPGNAAGQVQGAISVYWAVAMNGTWFCSAQPAQIALGALSPYQNYQLGFNPAATNWNNLTIGAAGATIGGQAPGALAGNITGAGLVIAHNDASASDMNFQNFEIITNLAVGTPPSIDTGIPLAVGVASGGGASFGVTASGTQPFTYGWTVNGAHVSNGGRFFGADTATLTIVNLNSSDNNASIVAFVTNSAGFDESDSIFGPTTLTVTNPPVGQLYYEAFPFVGPATGSYPISNVGWTEAVPATPNSLYQATASTSLGAVFAFLGSANTTVYYATTTSDTNQSGLPFPNINLASYPNLSFSVDIAPQSSSSNVTAYLAVELNDGSWYVAASPLPVPTTVDSSTFLTYTTAFNPAAANWKNLTVAGSGGIIGSPAASNLKGVMTGAGLVFVTVGTGGTMNFANFYVNGSGLGGINVSRTGGNINLTWVGNPAVNLQSTTSLSPSNWTDVPNTLGLYSVTLPITGSQQFYRLVQHP